MPIKVLIVDDSALVRQLLAELLGQDRDIRVVGTAPDPFIAREKIKALNPDVITLDIEMPRMDGLTFLEKVMTLHPMPVLVVSTLTQRGADVALQALEMGAVDYVAKPLLDLREGLAALGDELIAKVKAAAGARIRPRLGVPMAPQKLIFDRRLSTQGWIVAVGASTGGVEALQTLLTALPGDAPAVLVTQHMPEGFTASFAQRLNTHCAMDVTEARDGARVMQGHAFIASGNHHLELARSGAHYICRVSVGAPVSGHRPSVDVLFRSVARVAGKNATGVILTGMGGDGAEGLLEMRRAGAHTLGQDKASCLIYGMPKVAKEIGAVEMELPLSRIPREILAQGERAAQNQGHA